MAGDHRRPALLYQASVVKLLAMLFISVCILNSTPGVHSQSTTAQFIYLFNPFSPDIFLTAAK